MSLWCLVQMGACELQVQADAVTDGHPTALGRQAERW
jgi:hypothetical protein